MIHLAYPTVQFKPQDRKHVFKACVRYLSSSARTPPKGYKPVSSKTPNETVIYEAAEQLVPEYAEQLFQRPPTRLYEKADIDKDDLGHGSSLDLAYLLAVIHCYRSFVFANVVDAGDVWCTGQIQFEHKEMRAVLYSVDDPGFLAKLEGFFAQSRDRLFLVSAANAHKEWLTSGFLNSRRVLTLAAFSDAFSDALKKGALPEPKVVLVGSFELPKLVATLFEAPTAPAPQQGAPTTSTWRLPRRPYKWLDPFGLEDTDLFYGRDHDLAQLQSEFEASRVLIRHYW